MKTYADRLKYALKLSGFSQAGLARQSGVSQQSIQYLCRQGKGSTHTNTFAKMMRVNAEWLENGVGLPRELKTSDRIREEVAHYGVRLDYGLDDMLNNVPESKREHTLEAILAIFKLVETQT